MEQQPIEEVDTGFSTFIGVLVSVCGNVKYRRIVLKEQDHLYLTIRHLFQ